jgi:hypothetical protein
MMFYVNNPLTIARSTGKLARNKIRFKKKKVKRLTPTPERLEAPDSRFRDRIQCISEVMGTLEEGAVCKQTTLPAASSTE